MTAIPHPRNNGLRMSHLSCFPQPAALPARISSIVYTVRPGTFRLVGRRARPSFFVSPWRPPPSVALSGAVTQRFAFVATASSAAHRALLPQSIGGRFLRHELSRSATLPGVEAPQPHPTAPTTIEPKNVPVPAVPI